MIFCSTSCYLAFINAVLQDDIRTRDKYFYKSSGGLYILG